MDTQGVQKVPGHAGASEDFGLAAVAGDGEALGIHSVGGHRVERTRLAAKSLKLRNTELVVVDAAHRILLREVNEPVRIAEWERL